MKLITAIVTMMVTMLSMADSYHHSTTIKEVLVGPRYANLALIEIADESQNVPEIGANN